jgi:hypothetical protein
MPEAYAKGLEDEKAVKELEVAPTKAQQQKSRFFFDMDDLQKLQELDLDESIPARISKEKRGRNLRDKLKKMGSFFKKQGFSPKRGDGTPTTSGKRSPKLAHRPYQRSKSLKGFFSSPPRPRSKRELTSKLSPKGGKSPDPGGTSPKRSKSPKPGTSPRQRGLSPKGGTSPPGKVTSMKENKILTPPKLQRRGTHRRSSL